MRIIIAAALAAAVSACSPAFAGVPDLLKTLEQRGATVALNDHLCSRGLYGAYYEASQTVVICLDKHRGDLDELEDTIKHEAMHHVQQCAGGPIYKSDFIRSRATPKDLSALKLYPPSEHAHELEAKVIAREASVSDVVWLINRFCN